MRLILRYLSILSLFLFIGCSSSNKNIDIKKQLKIPKNYNTTNNLEIKDNWLYSLGNSELNTLVHKALNNNYKVKQLFYDIDISKQQLISSGSYLFPELTGSFKDNNSGDFNGSSSSSTGNFTLNLNYEIDLWSKLSDSKKQANINLLETKALYEEAKQKLIADVVVAYFNIIESNKILNLYRKSLKKKQEQLQIINSRYYQGLNTALDTYQAKSTVFEQLSKIKEQETVRSNAIYSLENLLGMYPKGLLNTNKDLPYIDSKIGLGLPQDLISRKPSLSAAWSRLLSQNYKLAITHKQRLPSLSLSSSLEKTTTNGSPLLWSLIGNITTPIFNAGRLKSNEEIERINLKKIEFAYLDEVYSAYLNIESLLVKEKNLKEQYKSILELKTNSKKSYDIAYSQYLKGLVEYNTVLTNQNNYLDSLVSVIQIKNQLLQTRVNLHLALGGDFLRKNKEDK